MSLNPRQQKFAELYHRYGNATRAYGEAYDAPKTANGTYPAWVSSDGNRLVKNEKVRIEIERLKGEVASLASMTREEMADYLFQAINTPIEDIGPESPLCEEYTVDESGKIKVKAVSKIAAIRELARLTGMDAPQKIEISAENEFLGMLAALTQSKND
jgi:phage terminase small subunit